MFAKLKNAINPKKNNLFISTGSLNYVLIKYKFSQIMYYYLMRVMKLYQSLFDLKFPPVEVE